MAQLIINSFKEFETHVGKELGVSEYLVITQEQINLFADATLDHQWIHTDPKRAASESHFGNAIAHGFLTLSLVPHFWEQIAEVRNTKMLINYGIEELRFNQPVVVGSSVRLKVYLKSIVDLRGIAKAHLNIEMEIKDSKKSAFNGTMVFLYHFINS